LSTPRDVAIEFENNMAIHANKHNIFNKPETISTLRYFIITITEDAIEFENTMAMHTATY
jgi:hypothetical protein